MVPTLIERLAGSELGELEVREDGWRDQAAPTDPVADVSDADVMATARSVRAGRAGLAADAGTRPRVTSQPASDAGRTEPARGLITSPAVGYFAPRDGVAVGGRLRSGDAIGHVDMLGVRHEVVSPIDGMLRTIEVEAGQAVEYGQPIARLVARCLARS